MIPQKVKVRIYWYPLYSNVRQLLNILNGVKGKLVHNLSKTIWSQTGTPQNPLDWSDPDTWIDERLSGAEAELAKRIWNESSHSINPRYFDEAYGFIKSYGLFENDNTGVNQLSKRGEAFLSNDVNLIREIDLNEGLVQILSILSTKTKAKIKEIMSEWEEFLGKHTKLKAYSSSYYTLRHRLLNLVERSLISQEGNTYFISQQGLDYEASFPPTKGDSLNKVMSAVRDYNEEQRKLLKKQLSTMPPKSFEFLIRQLLEAMGYQNVTVTKEGGDKGVDVVATVEFGITTITEVVQAKRQKGNIGRPVLDQLRGALPYFKALQGTLITLGNFSKGCKEYAIFTGAAPITLIDGEKLLDLLAEHEIGLRVRNTKLYEMNSDFFREFDEVPQVEDTLISEESIGS